MLNRQSRVAVSVTARRAMTLTVVALLAPLVSCGKGAETDEAARTPSRSGEVWEVSPSRDRREAGAELLAFVSGTHVLLVDGNDTYAGMRLTRGGKAPDGGQPLALAGGIEATLAPAGDSMQLRFATGESLALHRRAMKGSSR